MTRGDVVVASLTATETLVDVVHRLVDMDQAVDDSRAMSGRHGQVAVGDWEHCGRIVCLKVQVKSVGKLQSNLEERLIGPVAEPIEYATIEECRRSGCPRGQTILGRVHREYDVEVLRDLLREPAIELLVRVEHETITLRTLFACCHERSVLVSLEQPRNLGVGKQSVHPLQETRVENVGLVHDETDLLALAPRTTEDSPEILVKVFTGVLVGDLDLEYAEAVHPSNETRQCCLNRQGQHTLDGQGTTHEQTFPLPETPIRSKWP